MIPSHYTIEDVVWEENEWFVDWHLTTCKDNPEFMHWWFEKYGCPQLFAEEGCQNDEYWTRCAFALMGWVAATNKLNRG